MSGPCIVPPPPDVKLIIDKMADYVARNGPEFEIVVRRRNDERFRFVEADHPHHAYYLHKKEAFLQVTLLASCLTNSRAFCHTVRICYLIYSFLISWMRLFIESDLSYTDSIVVQHIYCL